MESMGIERWWKMVSIILVLHVTACDTQGKLEVFKTSLYLDLFIQFKINVFFSLNFEHRFYIILSIRLLFRKILLFLISVPKIVQNIWGNVHIIIRGYRNLFSKLLFSLLE